MGYVRLKHTLSALALDLLNRAPRRRPTPWLLAYARLAPDGGPVPLATLRRAAARHGPAGPRALARLEALGLLERTGGSIRLSREYVTDRAYFLRQVQRLERALRDADRRREAARIPLRRGILLFNAGLFFECHEYLEDVWRRTIGGDRDFYHGIIQAAAALYHYEKGNPHGARTLLAKAQAKLAAYPPGHRGVDVRRLRRTLQRWARGLAAGDAGRVLGPREFPSIAILRQKGAGT